jgi:hypothetical protein
MTGRIHGIPISNATPTDGQVLKYVAANGDWEPGAAGVSIKSMQAGTVSITGTNKTGTATISSVTMANAALIFLGWTGPITTGVSMAYDMPYITLTNSTTVTATRCTGYTGHDLTVAFMVVEFTSLKSCQYGTISVATGSTSGTAAITSVNTAKAVLLYLGTNGSTNITMVEAYHCVQLSLTNSTTVTATRYSGASGGALTVGFCVAEFAN